MKWEHGFGAITCLIIAMSVTCANGDETGSGGTGGTDASSVGSGGMSASSSTGGAGGNGGKGGGMGGSGGMGGGMGGSGGMGGGMGGSGGMGGGMGGSGGIGGGMGGAGGGGGSNFCQTPPPQGQLTFCGGSVSAGAGMPSQCAVMLCDEVNNQWEATCDAMGCTCSYNNVQTCTCTFSGGASGCDGVQGNGCCPMPFPDP